MTRAARIKPISYFKANAAEIIQELGEVGEPMIITQNGEAKAIVQDIVSYEKTQETLALLKILALANRNIGVDNDCVFLHLLALRALSRSRRSANTCLAGR
jgi:prevent-host-death family protein